MLFKKGRDGLAGVIPVAGPSSQKRMVNLRRLHYLRIVKKGGRDSDDGKLTRLPGGGAFYTPKTANFGGREKSD